MSFFSRRLRLNRSGTLSGSSDASPTPWRFEAQLCEHKIRPIRNDIPAYHTRNDPRYRVFVVGKDIFRYRKLFGEPRIERA